ncbi:MAG: hypothetical protein K5925_05960 [Bacilli bacterium]|nr:hypothetical protein [Bacilli bacterium]
MKNTNKEDEEIKISTKHMPLRIVLFVLALAAAGTAFAIFFTSLNEKSAGYQRITATPKKEAPAYQLSVEAMYYLDGKSSDINAKIGELQTVLSENLFTIYATLDEYGSYNTHSSIGDLNKHIGQEVQVSELLYTTLKKAYDYSDSYSNYSIYAQPIYDFWDNITHLDAESRVNQDVVNYPDNQTYLNGLLTYCCKEHCTVSFLEGNKIKVELSNEYRTFIEENQVESPVLSLNILKVPLMVEYVKNVFEERGYKNGYLFTPDDYSVNLSGHKKLEHIFYVDQPETSSYLVGLKTMYEGGHTGYSSLRFHTYAEDGIYNFKKDDVTYYRHLNLNLTSGLPNQLISNLVVIKGDEEKIDELALKANELNKDENLEDLYTRLTSNEFTGSAFIVSNNKDDKIAISSSIFEKTTIAQSIAERVIQK